MIRLALYTLGSIFYFISQTASAAPPTYKALLACHDAFYEARPDQIALSRRQFATIRVRTSFEKDPAPKNVPAGHETVMVLSEKGASQFSFEPSKMPDAPGSKIFKTKIKTELPDKQKGLFKFETSPGHWLFGGGPITHFEPGAPEIQVPSKSLTLPDAKKNLEMAFARDISFLPQNDLKDRLNNLKTDKLIAKDKKLDWEALLRDWLNGLKSCKNLGFNPAIINKKEALLKNLLQQLSTPSARDDTNPSGTGR